MAGKPFLYYAYKVMEIASHMWGDIFATAPGDDGHGTDFHKNLHTYNPHVQAWLSLVTASWPRIPTTRGTEVHEPRVTRLTSATSAWPIWACGSTRTTAAVQRIRSST